MDTQANEKFEGWCIVELMGHNVIAGFVTEVVIAGGAMLRVDVPEVSDDRASFSKFFAPSAVYGITPTTEESARTAASRIRARPVDVWIVPNPKPQLIAKVADLEQEEIDALASDDHYDDDEDSESPF